MTLGRTMFRLLALGLLVLAIVPAANAYNFQVTEAEWSSWPPYCKARYASVRVGRTSEFGGRVRPDEIEHWHQIIGADAWYGLHHFCAGLAHSDRAKMQTTANKREFEFRRALTEFGYMIRNTPPTDQFYAETLTRIGLVHREKGDLGGARRYYEQAIANNPSFVGGYLGMYQLLRDQGRTGEARDILLRADSASGGTSAEVKYFLGMISMDLGDVSSAATFAREAYALGYPLPALRNRLAKSGVEL